MNNYEFCARFALTSRANRAEFKVLDYGCGAGETIGLMRGADLNAVGCEVFYGGGSYLAQIPEDLRPFIFRMEDDRAPFPDATFDLVVNNQVLEHVADLERVVREIARVLKPGGVCLSLFSLTKVFGAKGIAAFPSFIGFQRKPRLVFITP